MKSRITLSILSLFAFTLPATALAADEHGSRHAAAKAPAASDRMVDGIVKKLNRGTGKVTLSHGPLQNLGMPAMTMEFAVKDAKWLNDLKEGARVRFLADRVDGAFTVVRLEPATEK